MSGADGRQFIERWSQQFRKGVLELAVLLCLAKQERYGYELVRMVASVAGNSVGEGTIYPLLARLERDELIGSRWDAQQSNRPRRYYRLSDKGREVARAMLERWSGVGKGLNRLARSL